MYNSKIESDIMNFVLSVEDSNELPKRLRDIAGALRCAIDLNAIVEILYEFIKDVTIADLILIDKVVFNLKNNFKTIISDIPDATPETTIAEIFGMIKANTPLSAINEGDITFINEIMDIEFDTAVLIFNAKYGIK